MDNCKDAPKLVWLLDIRARRNPVIIGNSAAACRRRRTVHARWPLRRAQPASELSRDRSTATCRTRPWRAGSTAACVSSARPKDRRAWPTRRRTIEEIGYYIPEAPPRESERHDPDQSRDRGRDGTDLRQRSLHWRALHSSLHRERASRLGPVRLRPDATSRPSRAASPSQRCRSPARGHARCPCWSRCAPCPTVQRTFRRLSA